MRVAYGKGFAVSVDMRAQVERLQEVISDMPQIECRTENTFHAGMLYRDVWRDQGSLIVGKVHKKDHLYEIVSGTVLVTTDDGAKEITGPAILQCKAGTKRAVFAVTDAHTRTIHRTDALTVEEAVAELVEHDPKAMFDDFNKRKIEVIQ